MNHRKQTLPRVVDIQGEEIPADRLRGEYDRNGGTPWLWNDALSTIATLVDRGAIPLEMTIEEFLDEAKRATRLTVGDAGGFWGYEHSYVDENTGEEHVECDEFYVDPGPSHEFMANNVEYISINGCNGQITWSDSGAQLELYREEILLIEKSIVRMGGLLARDLDELRQVATLAATRVAA